MKLDTDLESVQEVRSLLEQAKVAQQIISNMTQEQIDKIVDQMAQAALSNSEQLAALAVEETGFGNIADKREKNLFSARDIYESIKNKKTAGVISTDETNKVWEVAEPVGIVAGIIPSTNPTSTAIFKALIAVKSRNAIVISPHPSALQCTNETVKVMATAAVQAGAPEGLVSCLNKTSMKATNELMEHKLTDVILATGGSAMVKAAYSSGKPAYGVGPGNVPVLIHSSANLPRAAKDIVLSKTFDYGTICASEQALVVEKSIKREFVKELENQGTYFLDDYEKKRIEKIVAINGQMNPKIVGKSPQALAEMAGIVIPDDCKLLAAEESNIGGAYPFSIELLTSIIALYTVDNWDDGNFICQQILEYGGLGHTVGIYCEDDKLIQEFGLQQPASRVIVNTGTTFGGIGATTNIRPSMTLGCGSHGGNVTSDNIGPENLLNIKRIAYGVREMKKEPVNTQHYNNSLAVPTNSDKGISKEEVMDIVKTVLQELKV